MEWLTFICFGPMSPNPYFTCTLQTLAKHQRHTDNKSEHPTSSMYFFDSSQQADALFQRVYLQSKAQQANSVSEFRDTSQMYHEPEEMDFNDDEMDGDEYDEEPMDEDDGEVGEDEEKDEDSSLKSISTEDKTELEPSSLKSRPKHLRLDISKIRHNSNSSYLVNEDEMFDFQHKRSKYSHSPSIPSRPPDFQYNKPKYSEPPLLPSQPVE